MYTVKDSQNTTPPSHFFSLLLRSTMNKNTDKKDKISCKTTVALMFSLFIAGSIKEPTSTLESSLHTEFCVKILVKAVQGNNKKIVPRPLKSTIDSKWSVLQSKSTWKESWHLESWHLISTYNALLPFLHSGWKQQSSCSGKALHWD